MQCQRRFLTGDLFPAEIFLHQRFAGGGNRLVENVFVFGSKLAHPVGHRHFTALAVRRVSIRFGLNQVDHRHILAGFIGDEHGAKGVAEFLAQSVKGMGKVIIRVVAFIDKEHLGHARGACRVKCKLGADLYAAFSVYENHGAAGNTERLTHLALKIREAGGVDHVDFDVFPHHVAKGGGNGKPALLLFGVKIADGISVSNLSKAVGLSGQVQHRFGKRSLSASTVPEQGEISNGLCVKLSHKLFPPYRATDAPEIPIGDPDYFYYTEIFTNLQVVFWKSVTAKQRK